MTKNVNSDVIVTIVSRVCKRGHRYATDFEQCPVCIEIQTASKKQFEEDCKAMCGNCPGKSVELSQDGELWEHDTNESYGPLQCFATPIRRAREERTA